MRLVYFTHSLRSCWNHGNAHFLRGVLGELVARGWNVAALEPEDGWSAQNLAADHGSAALDAWRATYPELKAATYPADYDVTAAVDGADVVIVHEWNEPSLAASLGALRKAGARFTLLFHDTHHRAVSDPASMTAFDLSGFDGVLAFGEALAKVYRDRGWGRRVFVWHEAADTRLFRPPQVEGPREGLVWVGNWGDGERTAELEAFLLRPAREAGLPLDIHGVRYPSSALALLEHYGARYRGWLPNTRAPEVFARKLATVHVPRSAYVRDLPGIPTIRVFEALACGIPLMSAPWDDAEGLFRPGRDFLFARDGAEMTRRLRDIVSDGTLRASLAANGLETIRARHTCAHRADELVGILAQLSGADQAAEPVAVGSPATAMPTVEPPSRVGRITPPLIRPASRTAPQLSETRP